MAHVVFYEKPGCGGNARQKALLSESGHYVEPRNLLAEKWSEMALMAFFGSRPVAEWFNRASPRVRSGEVAPDALEGPQALALMLADPLLIRRPLLQVEDRREVGWDEALVDAWIGLKRGTGVAEGCPKQNSDHRCP